VRIVLLCCAAAIAAGCGSHRYYNVTPDATRSLREQRRASAAAWAGMPAESLSTYMAKVRELQAGVRSTPPSSLATLETSDKQLAAALFGSTLAPSPDSFMAVADEYRRLKVHDKAHQFLSRALAAAPKDARVHDALARLWRDAGLPHLAIGDAHRAVFYDRNSAAAHNTLGTVLQALGDRTGARREYERAASLDPLAAYAHNNICYSWVLEGAGERAVQACRRAISLDPGSAIALNNAGLAFALTGDMNASRASFAAAGPAATAQFNNGIVQLAARQWGEASRLFLDALTTDPTMREAGVRARQAQSMRTDKP
jgi:Flp pilus assembly protein TadD